MYLHPIVKTIILLSLLNYWTQVTNDKLYQTAIRSIVGESLFFFNAFECYLDTLCLFEMFHLSENTVNLANYALLYLIKIFILLHVINFSI